MTNNDQQQFADALSDVLAVYGREMSPGVLNVYWNALKPFDVSAVLEALQRHTQNPDNGQYAPKPADLIKLMGGNSTDRALLAWAKVRRAISEVGAVNSVVFDDPLIHAVISDMGGWPTLCNRPEDELKFIAREFENRYRTFLFHSPDSYPSCLIGLAETHNRQAGFPCDAPLLVGPVERCRLVYRNGLRELTKPSATADLAMPAIERRTHHAA